MEKHTAAYWINTLQLQKHVEGGAFRETYRAPLTLPQQVLPGTFKGDRNAATAIYFLLEKGDFSAFHRIAADEMWHFYAGDTLHIYEIKPDGALIIHALGQDIAGGAAFQALIPAGSWFASRVESGSYALVGCTVAPGFDFADFELAERAALSDEYPQHQQLVVELTR
ncbi:cupin domain-containing protein [Chitinophaga horti]|uniref:Cupin domain-containing protein n=1 Tax=Chitinophaga horti TaxID=2920382 RepID=A0ABY6J1V1_9BACT|nr:cupin domain-containing protein [Chitinophaga horti]UYQ93648.1 cupin domain-containing protein [Chitinophaga horti]